MAERRMFAKSIINSARFLRMPPTSRLLYYDLGMAADDDGIVEAFTVMRTTGAAEDDLRVLTAKGFIQILNDDLVSYIIDWKKNNLIKNDRYHESIYKDLLVRIQGGTQMEPDWNPSGTQMEPEVRLGKGSVVKDRVVEDRIGDSSAEPQAASALNTADPPVFELILIDKTTYQITQKDIDRWKDAYPAVDLFAELRKMAAWLDANPNRRKTRRGIKSFVNTWLSREQDKGGIYRGQKQTAQSSRYEYSGEGSL